MRLCENRIGMSETMPIRFSPNTTFCVRNETLFTEFVSPEFV